MWAYGHGRVGRAWKSLLPESPGLLLALAHVKGAEGDACLPEMGRRWLTQLPFPTFTGARWQGLQQSNDLSEAAISWLLRNLRIFSELHELPAKQTQVSPSPGVRLERMGKSKETTSFGECSKIHLISLCV